MLARWRGRGRADKHTVTEHEHGELRPRGDDNESGGKQGYIKFAARTRSMWVKACQAADGRAVGGQHHQNTAGTSAKLA